MLLVPLIENCFKHGANNNIGKTSISIDINVKDDFLYFDVSNTIPKREGSKRMPAVGGIGLANVKKRLELGYEKNDYDLSLLEKDQRFYVNLKLKV